MAKVPNAAAVHNASPPAQATHTPSASAAPAPMPTTPASMRV